jgi:hypothetical protein
MNLRRQPAEPTLTLGQTGPWWRKTRVSLHGPDLATHKHVIGTTGVGKSKLLASVYTQLLTQHIPGALIDPHADLADEALSLLLDAGYPTDKLLYIEFSRQDRFLPFNVLSQPYDDHTVARNIVEVCKRAWPSLAGGAAPMFEAILLHGSLVLVQNRLPITELPRVLMLKAYRDRLLANVTDRRVIEFWQDTFDRLPVRDQLDQVQSTMRRAYILTFTKALRYSLGQTTNVLDFRALMDSGTSVIFNLGGLDEETQKFLGCLITVGYEVAALSRADQPAGDRCPYHLILDEFSMFSATSEEALARILSLARKYNLTLTMAHQTWSQVSSRLQGALQNTTSIAFRLGETDAMWRAPGLVKFDPHEVKHEVEEGTARTHPLYMSLPEQVRLMIDELTSLPRQTAYLKLGNHVQKFQSLDVGSPRITPRDLGRIKDSYAARLMVQVDKVIPQVDPFERPALPKPPARHEYARARATIRTIFTSKAKR